MPLPTCPNCSHSFTWSAIFKSLWKFKQAVACPTCKEKLYPSTKSRQKLGWLTLLPLIVAFSLQGFGVSLMIAVPLYMFLVVGTGSLIPYYYTLVNKEEPLWKRNIV